MKQRFNLSKCTRQQCRVKRRIRQEIRKRVARLESTTHRNAGGASEITKEVTGQQECGKKDSSEK